MIKRLIDIVGASVGLMAAVPLLLGCAMLIASTLGRPVLFRQRRPGRDEVPFVLLKFRTMRDERDKNGALLSDAERLTAVGRLLRSLSLDELPSLINVLRGDMSLVGPRPLLMDYLPLYTLAERRRHSVRPGLTGWAQVNGRNTLSWDEKFAYDLWYVDNRKLRLDMWIIMLTLLKVVRRDGISAAGAATMPALDSERAAWRP